MRVTESAYAKLNLTLEVGERRPDGYHDLISVMTCCSLCDTVTVETAGRITMTCDDATLSCDETNLCIRAARAFFAETGVQGGAAVALTKRIPMQAGLGGGSADGAAVLRGLRRLYAPELPDRDLERIGALVGSDVPFCVRVGTAKAQGRGEKLETLPGMPVCYFVLCQPPERFSTGTMYSAVDAQNPPRIHTTNALIDALACGDLRGIASQMTNTFEAVLLPDSEVLSVRHTLLKCGALGAMMSGSGSAVFGIFDEEHTAKSAFESLKQCYPATFLARNV